MQAQKIAEQIQRITGEIEALQRSLGELNSTPMEGERRILVEECLQPEMVVNFKAAVDNMRLFLWEYLEAAARQTGDRDMDYALQAYRIRRATEMLETLNRTAQRENEVLPAVSSFFERIENVADQAMQKHENSQDRRM